MPTDVQDIQCLLGTDGTERVTVTADALIGGYGIHRCIRNRIAQGPGWTVTHRGTGKSVWSTEDFAAAVRVAQWLDQQGIIPTEGRAALDWRANLAPQAYTELIVTLQTMAPRLGTVAA